MAPRTGPKAQIERNMTNWPPDADTQEAMESLRKVYKRLANAIVNAHPEDCRERSLALTNLEQSLMWTMAALARTNHDNGG